MIVRRVLLFLSIFLLSQIASAYSLDVSALSPEQKARLLTQFPNATQSLSLAEMDQIVSHLYLWKQFDAVAVYRYPNTGTYVLEVVTTRKISELRFLGLDQFSEVEAQKILDINTGEKFDQNQLAEAGDRLSQAYADKGYLGTEITFAFPTLKDGSVALDVEVNEGTITKISDIKIETPNNDLNNALNTRLKKHRGKPLTEKTFAEINQDARIFFNTHGYHRAELSGPAIKLNSER
ncbi:MAG: POTRA domain-containing protein, partial [Pseudobdellovibrionaceae bacterium]